jgi:hypothetical protein
MRGMSFLDTIRDNEVWRLTKETAKNTGVASVQALFEIAKATPSRSLSSTGFICHEDSAYTAIARGEFPTLDLKRRVTPLDPTINFTFKSAA